MNTASPIAGSLFTERGATLVEFTIGGLVFLFIMLAGIELALYCYASHRVQHVANEVSRAMTHGRIRSADLCGAELTNACRAASIGRFLLDSAGAATLPRNESVQLTVFQGLEQSHASPLDYPHTTCFPARDSTCPGLDPGEPGEHIFVRLEHDVPLILGAVSGHVATGVLVRNEPFEDS